jgi:hypothetical protein
MWLKSNQWYTPLPPGDNPTAVNKYYYYYYYSEIISFTVIYMFICIQSGIFPISVVGHLQMLF